MCIMERVERREISLQEGNDAAGKTGTAQAFSSGKPTINLSHVGFAPYENRKSLTR